MRIEEKKKLEIINRQLKFYEKELIKLEKIIDETDNVDIVKECLKKLKELKKRSGIDNNWINREIEKKKEEYGCGKQRN